MKCNIEWAYNTYEAIVMKKLYHDNTRSSHLWAVFSQNFQKLKYLEIWLITYLLQFYTGMTVLKLSKNELGCKPPWSSSLSQRGKNRVMRFQIVKKEENT